MRRRCRRHRLRLRLRLRAGRVAQPGAVVRHRPARSPPGCGMAASLWMGDVSQGRPCSEENKRVSSRRGRKVAVNRKGFGDRGKPGGVWWPMLSSLHLVRQEDHHKFETP